MYCPGLSACQDNKKSSILVTYRLSRNGIDSWESSFLAQLFIQTIDLISIRVEDGHERPCLVLESGANRYCGGSTYAWVPVVPTVMPSVNRHSRLKIGQKTPQRSSNYLPAPRKRSSSRTCSMSSRSITFYASQPCYHFPPSLKAQCFAYKLLNPLGSTLANTKRRVRIQAPGISTDRKGARRRT